VLPGRNLKQTSSVRRGFPCKCDRAPDSRNGYDTRCDTQCFKEPNRVGGT